jgi:hypothetical protein
MFLMGQSLKKILRQLLLLSLFLFIANATYAQNQAGMVNKPGGGQVFSAEQYKIDRMKAEMKPNTTIYSGSKTPSTTTTNSPTSTYEPGTGWRTSKRVWRKKNYELDYRTRSKKSKRKETMGLSFSYPKDTGVEVTHENDGIEAYDNTVFHDHRKEYQEYNNIFYALNYSFKEGADSSFGFGLQFIARNSSFHDCDDYTFLSFFITAGGEFMYYKKKMGENDKFTSGFFPELRDDIPEMFDLSNYTKSSKNFSIKEISQLGVIQWEDELMVIINGEIIYQDKLSRCPVQLSKTPYNLFLNKGAVVFYEGEEIYVEKKH